MGVAAVLTTISVGIPAVLPAASAFLAGMYFGIIINTKNTDDE